MRLRMILFMFALLSSVNVSAKDVDVNLTVQPDTIFIGDPINIRLQIEYKEGYQIQIPDLRVSLLPLELEDPHVSHEMTEDDKMLVTLDFVAFAFDTGSVVIPSQRINYWLGSDSTSQSRVYTDSLWLHISSMLPPDAQELRDIKEPIEIPQPFRYWNEILIGALLLAILAIIYYFWRKKEDKPFVPFTKPKVIRPAHEIAFEALERLKDTRLIEKGSVDPYYVELSRLLREYIENRWFLKALEMTTSELLDAIRKEGLSDEISKGIRDVLTESDLVKFAKLIPESERGSLLYDDTYQLVSDTKLVEVSSPPESETPTEENSPAEEASDSA